MDAVHACSAIRAIRRMFSRVSDESAVSFIRSRAAELGIDGVTFLNPCRCQRWVSWKAQVDWETAGLERCDVALFWIPNQEVPVEGRDYAQTTRMELLESLALGRKVILGIDTDIRASEYMRYKARRYGVKHVHKSLEGCLRELKDLMGGK